MNEEDVRFTYRFPAIVIAILLVLVVIVTMAGMNVTMHTTDHTSFAKNYITTGQNEYIAVPVGIAVFIGTGTSGRDPESTEKKLDVSDDLPNLTAALDLARAGFPVFPVKLDKTPLTAHGFKDATTDEAQIREWWTRWPDAGIGMPTGPKSGVVVLDEDPRHGGDVSLKQFIEENGALPAGPVSRTGGGGRHFFFSHPGARVPTVHGFRPGLDLQADDAYVILPPSPHPSGKRYEWVLPLLSTERHLPPPKLLAATEGTHT